MVGPMKASWGAVLVGVVGCAGSATKPASRATSDPDPVLVATTVSCRGGSTSVVEREGRGTYEWCRDDRGLREGRAVVLDPHGVILVEERYARGVLDSRIEYDTRRSDLATFVVYHPEGGGFRATGSRVSGLLEGPVVIWDELGNVLKTITYHEGRVVSVAVNPNEVAIRDVFAQVQQAITKHEPTRLPALVDARTLATYEQLRKHALLAPRVAMITQPIGEQILILMMRAQLGARLRSMDGSMVLAAGIEPPPYVYKSLSLTGLADVRISGDLAIARTTYRGKPSVRELHFVKQRTAWKLDLLALMEQDDFLAFAAQRTGESSDATAEAYVRAVTHGNVGSTLWQPIGE